jgi:hypothetical protein
MVNPPTSVERARHSESRFHSDLAARRGWGGWVVSEAAEGFVTSLAGVLWLELDTAASGGAMGAAEDVLLIDTILP